MQKLPSWREHKARASASQNNSGWKVLWKESGPPSCSRQVWLKLGCSGPCLARISRSPWTPTNNLFKSLIKCLITVLTKILSWYLFRISLVVLCIHCFLSYYWSSEKTKLVKNSGTWTSEGFLFTTGKLVFFTMNTILHQHSELQATNRITYQLIFLGTALPEDIQGSFFHFWLSNFQVHVWWCTDILPL